MNETVASYIPLVDFLEEILGKNSEIVLHDFSNPNHSVVDIRNGKISGRALGAPATDFALRMLREDQHGDKEFIANYVSHSGADKPLRSTSMFIRENGALVGMLCVNTDTSAIEQLSVLSQRVADMLLCACPSASEPSTSVLETERLTEPTGDLITRSIHDLTFARGLTPTNLNQTERMDIIRALNANGLFMLKGAVARVAEELDISEPSVYRYLQKVKKEG